MATPSASNSRAVSPAPSTDSDSPSRASGSISASASSKGIFRTADTTFNPSPYNPPQRPLPAFRQTPAASTTPAPVTTTFDLPQSTVPPFDGLFIRPPFETLPDNTPLPSEGMNYSVMHEHPRWFLDIRDFITLDSNPEGAYRYPRELEPPRPRRQKDLLLRCTFCPRTYAGVNAKSMWTRHVREKHRVILSKAWSDTATSARRVSAAKLPPTASTGPADVAPATAKKPPPPTPAPASPSTAVSLKTKPPAPRGKPGPKPKPGSPAKAKRAQGSGKIVIPAQKPKPVAAVPSPSPAPPPPLLPPSRIVGGVVRKSASPPPPIGMLPPRMRAARKSFRASQGPLELQALQSQGSSTPVELDTPPQVASAAPVPEPIHVTDRDSIASTPPRDISDGVAPPATDKSLPLPFVGSEIQPQTTFPTATEVTGEVEPSASKASEDGEIFLTDKEIADILLADLDMDFQTPDEPEEEDVDMELEDEEEGLHPPISVGGLGEPMFGIEDDPFSLSSRPPIASTPIFSPAASPNTPEIAREDSVGRPATPETDPEPVVEEETPPLGRFKISSLAYLMDRSLAASPPPSPGPSGTPRSPTPPFDMDVMPSDNNGVDSDVPAATVFAAMEDVFVIKMKNNMDPELKERLFEHLRDQFGVVRDSEPAEASWARLPETAVRQIMSEGTNSDAEHASDGAAILGSDDIAELTEEFMRGSRGQVQIDLDEQLKDMVGQFVDEMAAPLQSELSMQLRDEIIVQVADQMREALVTQGDEAQVEFEWRRRYLERQLWVEDGGNDTEEVIQHPLHHLFLSKATPADMDMRIPC